MTNPILLEIADMVAVIRLNRPKQRNPLGQDGDGERIGDICMQIAANKTLRCAILTGNGPAFSAGGDLKAMVEKQGAFAGNGLQIREGYRQNIHQLVKALYHLPIPLIAAVNGPAIGLGNDVACLADIQIAAQNAKFGATFLKLGIIPGDGGAWLLPKIIGMSRAAQLIYTAQLIGSQTALEWGLVSQVTPDEDLMKEAWRLAEQICAQPPQALRMAKNLLRHGQSNSYEAVMDLSAAGQALLHQTQDHQEGVAAMLEKRKPEFTGE